MDFPLGLLFLAHDAEAAVAAATAISLPVTISIDLAPSSGVVVVTIIGSGATISMAARRPPA